MKSVNLVNFAGEAVVVIVMKAVIPVYIGVMVDDASDSPAIPK